MTVLVRPKQNISVAVGGGPVLDPKAVGGANANGTTGGLGVLKEQQHGQGTSPTKAKATTRLSRAEIVMKDVNTAPNVVLNNLLRYMMWKKNHEGCEMDTNERDIPPAAEN